MTARWNYKKILSIYLLVDILPRIVYKIFTMKLADKLQKLRIKNNLSMSEVARISEKAPDSRGRITQGYISRLESGKETNPSLMKLVTLCSIYKVQPNVLFSKNDLKKSTKK